MILALQILSVIIGILLIVFGLSLKVVMVTLYNALDPEDRKQIDDDIYRKGYYDIIIKKRSELTTKDELRKHLSFVMLRALFIVFGFIFVALGLI